MSRAYYNDNDPYCVQWLRNLIQAGLIADGDVDDRDIRNVRPEDLRGYRQVHLCAGVGGWSLALRLAQWPDNCEAWTGSFPCQPFTLAGKRLGAADPRHIWPEGFRLIGKCRPAIFFGEQVAHGPAKRWCSGVRSDLEAVGYAVGIASLPAVGVGARHIRSRFYYVANAAGAGQSLSEGSAALPSEPRQPSARACDWGHGAGNDWRSEPDVVRVVHGLSGRVGAVRGFGNAVVPPLAAAFIEASRDAINDCMREVA